MAMSVPSCFLLQANLNEVFIIVIELRLSSFTSILSSVLMEVLSLRVDNLR